MSLNNYIGRFAPSPTGPLHCGSLVTAVASYFQAKFNHGQWLVRIEDIDNQRKQKGASELILKTLEAHHLHWDSDVSYQSSNLESYYQAITQLQALNKVYRCQCSRKTIQHNIESQTHSIDKAQASIYPGTCRDMNHPIDQPHSLRLLGSKQVIDFKDILQGDQFMNIEQQDDFVIQKLDGNVTYQLAVAIDDAQQNITEVVRGVDLMNSTPKQIWIMSLLDYQAPQYCHLPLVCNRNGQKLSKHTGAASLDNTKAASQLWYALSFLNQAPPDELQNTSIQELHNWAIQNWAISKIRNKHNSLFYQ